MLLFAQPVLSRQLPANLHKQNAIIIDGCIVIKLGPDLGAGPERVDAEIERL
ncbi:hypothetical protein [Bradyrhizobium cenepequi]